MVSTITDPEHRRQRAAEMRTLARGINDIDARTTALRIADDYERLAERAAIRADDSK
jgi:hypothetical protein